MPPLDVYLRNSKQRTGKEYEGVLIVSMNFINAFAIIGSILIVAAIFFTFSVKENVTV